MKKRIILIALIASWQSILFAQTLQPDTQFLAGRQGCLPEGITFTTTRNCQKGFIITGLMPENLLKR